jgi:hypothetical protein
MCAAVFPALLVGASREARAASTGCDAVNSGAWNISASILTPATQTGSFQAGEKLSFTIAASLLGGGAAQFSGAFPANTTPVLNNKQPERQFHCLNDRDRAAYPD